MAGFLLCRVVGTRRIPVVGYNEVMVSRPFTWPPRLGRLRSMARTTTVLSGAVLAAFHGWLFATQVATGKIDDQIGRAHV